MSGVMSPDSGTCQIDGRTPWKDRVDHVRNIGVVFGQRSQLWWDVPVCDSFELLRDIYQIPESVYKQNLDRMAQLLDLGNILKTPARQLSLGQRMRCEIAAALLHDPRILFLDEPTIGLDAVSKIAVRDFIKELNREKKTTVILTTHDMQDIEALTERILLIGKGRILLDGTLEQLKQRSSTHKTITVDHTGKSFPQLEAVTVLKDLDGHAEILLDPATASVSDVISQIASRIEVKDISVTGASIDQTVVSLYKEFSI
jgi:ABC-2 type transport system ATP-binding protein